LVLSYILELINEHSKFDTWIFTTPSPKWRKAKMAILLMKVNESENGQKENT
jgi:hypothetical protein